MLLARTARPAEARSELLTATQLPNTAPALKARAFRALARLDQQATPPNPTTASAELLAALNLTPEAPEDIQLAAEIAESAADLPAAERAYRRYLALLEPARPSSHRRACPRPAGRAPPRRRRSPARARPRRPPIRSHAHRSARPRRLASDDPAKIAQAAPLLEKLHAANPQDANIARLLARVYLDTDHPDQADPLYAALISAQSQAGENPDPTLLDDRAEALLRLHRPGAAETLLKQAVANPAAFPNPAALGDAATHLAFAAAEIDDPRTTLQALALRATVLPPSPSTLFLEAMANDTLHRNARAIDLYRQFLTAAGTDYPDQAAQARQRLAALAPGSNHAAPKR